jgi:hypothetical protein
MFGIWVYNDELQIKFTFRSGPMIFGRVMALGLWNLAKYLVVTTFLLAIFGDIDLIFGIWMYSDELQIKFTIRSGPSFLAELWPLDFEIWQIFSCHHFISLWFEILTWFLVWECIIIIYRSTLKFICYSYPLTEEIKKRVKHLRVSLIFTAGTFVSSRHI